MRLTDKAVAGLTLPADRTDVIFFDDTLIGFGFRLRAGAGGRLLKSWVVQYRQGGVHRKYRIGAGEVLSAEQARGAARKTLAAVALGNDPQADRAGRRGHDRITFRSVADDFLTMKATRVRPRTLRELRRYLAGAYFRALHGMPIDKVDRRSIAARLISIERDSGAPTALKARKAISAMFVWAMQAGLTEGNPAIGTPAPAAGRGRDRVLSDAELGAIWRASAGVNAFGRIIRLLILTGSRRSEIGGLCWSEIDTERALWVLPAARSKNNRALSLPMMPMMAAILDQVPRRATRDQLFGERSAGFTDWHMGKLELDARSGVTGWVVHDIRRSVATGMANLGVAPHVIEQLLNHVSGHKGGIAGIYNRATYEREVRAALGLWHDHIRALAGGGERTIVPFASPAAT
jgi:integrase